MRGRWPLHEAEKLKSVSIDINDSNLNQTLEGERIEDLQSPFMEFTMDEEDLLDLAPAFLIAAAHVAAAVGVKKRDMNFGELAGEMATLSKLLENPSSPSQEQRYQRRIHKLLTGIERACMVCLCPNLRSISAS